MTRKVFKISHAEMVDMGGIPVRQPLPTAKMDQFDPFLLLHHHTAKIKPKSSPKDLGVGPHPHRGFSPVTFIFQGDVHHRDSRGNSSIVKAGGVQWMDVGMGIIHSERPSNQLAEKGGTQEIIQLWVNTPADYKFEQPQYIPIQRDEFNEIKPEKGDGFIHVVSGEHQSVTGPVKPKFPLASIVGQLDQGAQHTFDIPADYNAMLYLLDGEVSVKDHGLVEGLNLIYFDNVEAPIEIEAKADTRFLLVAGQPIKEPVATYGPFVLNNQTQIMEAMRDYQMGKMGVLVEEFD